MLAVLGLPGRYFFQRPQGRQTPGSAWTAGPCGSQRPRAGSRRTWCLQMQRVAGAHPSSPFGLFSCRQHQAMLPLCAEVPMPGAGSWDRSFCLGGLFRQSSAFTCTNRRRCKQKRTSGVRGRDTTPPRITRSLRVSPAKKAAPVRAGAERERASQSKRVSTDAKCQLTPFTWLTPSSPGGAALACMQLSDWNECRTNERLMKACCGMHD